MAFTDDLSPKFHDHAVGVFVELSVNFTVNGAVPDVGEPVKAATGATTPELTVMYPARVKVLLPAEFVAVR